MREILRAGTDIDCGGFIAEYATQALLKKQINMTDIDTALHRAFKVRLRLGHFDPPGPLQKIGPETICSEYALELARDGTRQGVVLIKNDNSTLPIEGKRLAALKTVAVIGPNFNLSQKIAGYYGGKSACGHNYWTIVDAVREQVQATGANVVAAKGVPDVKAAANATMLAEAVALARTAAP